MCRKIFLVKNEIARLSQSTTAGPFCNVQGNVRMSTLDFHLNIECSPAICIVSIWLVSGVVIIRHPCVSLETSHRILLAQGLRMQSDPYARQAQGRQGRRWVNVGIGLHEMKRFGW